MSYIDYVLTDNTANTLRRAIQPHTNSFMVIEQFKPVMDKDLQEQFDALIGDLGTDIGYPSRPSNKDLFIENLKTIILGFVTAISKNQWLGIYGGKDYYSHQEMTFNLSYTYTKRILEYLAFDLHAINFIPGALDRSESYSSGQKRMNKYFPTEGFIDDLMPFIYCIEAPFTGSTVCINYSKDNQKIKHCRLRNKIFSRDRQNLKIINDYLKQQHYPIKSPIRRIYTDDTEHGGRLYGAFQGIPANRVKLRQTLMINASQMIEVDFKSNHLNMAIVLFENEYPDTDDPLKLLATAIPNHEFQEIRGLLKSFVVRLINGSSDSGFEKSFDKMIEVERFNKTYDDSILINFEFAFNELLDQFKSSFPNIPLFEKLGNKLQKLEGDIMMGILLEAVEKDITVLPLHDACLCEQENVPHVKEMMSRHWSKTLNTKLAPIVEAKN
jgi:hypothetical protein